jgi:hypothetical protein
MADGDTSMQSVERTLTDGEVMARKNEHISIELEIDHLEEERKSAAADFKGRLEPKRARRKELLRTIETGRESYEVECVEVWDYQRNVIEVKRKDTGEVLDEQPMGFEERQEKLDEVDGGKNLHARHKWLVRELQEKLDEVDGGKNKGKAAKAKKGKAASEPEPDDEDEEDDESTLGPVEGE